MIPLGASRRLRGFAARALLATLMGAVVTVLERRLRRAFDDRETPTPDRADETHAAS